MVNVFDSWKHKRDFDLILSKSTKILIPLYIMCRKQDVLNYDNITMNS